MKKYYLLFIIFIFYRSFYGLADVTPIVQDEANQNLADKYFLEGLNRYLSRDYKQAVESWKKVLEIEPFHSRAMMYMEKSYEKSKSMENNYYDGVNKFKAGKYKEAKPYFEKTLLINPKHREAREYLNEIYEKLNMKVKIVKELKKDAEEIKEKEMTTDEELKLFAIGYDSKNNYLGAIEVIWEVTGNLDPIERKEFSSSLVYAPYHFDIEGTIRAIPDVGKEAATGLIKVKQGRLNAIKLRDTKNGKGDEITRLKMTTDQTMRIYCAGYDKNEEYINDVPIDWIMENGIDIMKQENSSSVLLNFKKVVQQNKILAKSKHGFLTIITNITVEPGKLQYLRIENNPEGQGEEVYSDTFTTDDEIKYYAIGYDAHDNYVGNVSADWKTTVMFKELEFLNTPRFFFEPTSPGRIVVTAKKDNILGDSTGIIEIKKSEAKYIAFIDQSSKIGKKINEIKIKAGESKEIYAAGFSAQNKFVDLYPVDWEIKGDIPASQLSARKGIELVYSNAPYEGIITGKHPNLPVTNNIPIIVEPDKPAKIVLSSKKEYNKNEVVFDISTTSDKSIELYSYLIDSYFNLIQKVVGEWKLSDEESSIIIADKSDNINFIPTKSGLKSLQVKDEKGFISDKIRIEIKPGTLNQILFVKDNSDVIRTNLQIRISSPVRMEAKGLDVHSNFIGLIPGDWKAHYENNDYPLRNNVSSVTLQLNKVIDNGILSFKNEQIQKSITFNVVSTQMLIAVKGEEPHKQKIQDTTGQDASGERQVESAGKIPTALVQEAPQYFDEEILRDIIKYYYDKRRYTKAIEELDRIVNGPFPKEMKNKALMFLGRSYFHIGEYRLALQVFSSLLEIYPEEALFWLNQVYKKID